MSYICLLYIKISNKVILYNIYIFKKNKSCYKKKKQESKSQSFNILKIKNRAKLY